MKNNYFSNCYGNNLNKKDVNNNSTTKIKKNVVPELRLKKFEGLYQIQLKALNKQPKQTYNQKVQL